MELNQAINAALHKSDEEEDLVVQWLLAVEASFDSHEDRGILGGNRNGRCYIHHNCKVAAVRLFTNYFAQDPIFNNTTFCRKYRMRRDLFLCIVESIFAFKLRFESTLNAIGRTGLSTL